MSVYLRQSGSFVFSGGKQAVAAKIAFGKEVEYGRITLIVRVVRSKDRQDFRRALSRMGLVANEIPGTEQGPHPESGLPRTKAFSVSGPRHMLDAIQRMGFVEGIACGDIRVPNGFAGRNFDKETNTPLYRPAPPQPDNLRARQATEQRRKGAESAKEVLPTGERPAQETPTGKPARVPHWHGGDGTEGPRKYVEPAKCPETVPSEWAEAIARVDARIAAE